MMDKKLWKKSDTLEKQIETFTVGKDRDLDLYLAEFDVLGSLAHITMLESVELLKKDELKILKTELIVILSEIRKGAFVIGEGIEDIHSQIELLLTDRLGDVGKKIHSGRSRNDQVLVDLRLFIRSQIKEIVNEVEILFNLLISLSERYKKVGMPGYTHTQAAMPSSFGLWFSAFAESFVDDLEQVNAAYKIINKNPLGSAAGYGSSFPLNRQMTTDLLGFEVMNYNAIYAQVGRGKSERVTSQAIASLAETCGRMASDIILFVSQNFNFLSFPDTLVTGSSIMPHKKNPDLFEILRAKCNRLKALPNEIMMITANLTTGYHRDLQLIKESFLPGLFNIQECLKILHFAMQHVTVREDILKDNMYQSVFSVEAINNLVVEEGLSFREAYHRVAREIESGEFKPPANTVYKHEGSIENLCNEKIVDEMQRVVNEFNFEKADRALVNLAG